MKSQVNSGWAPALSISSCARFSPASVTPPAASAPSSSTGRYLTAAEDLYLPGLASRGARRSWTRSRLARTCLALRPVDQLNHAIARLPSGLGAIAPVGEQQLPGRRRSCRSRCRGSRDARLHQLHAVRSPSGRGSARDGSPVMRLEAAMQLLSDLVAAGAGARTDRRVMTPPLEPRAQHALAITPASSPRQPACTAATARGAAITIGTQSAVITVGAMPLVVVTIASASAPRAGARRRR